MDLNALQQYMDFAEKNGLFNQYKNNAGFQAGSMSNFQPTVFNVPMMEANWARSMGVPSIGMPGGYASQNFFANLGGPPSAATLSSNPMDARVNAAFDRPYVQNQAPQMGNNYLARILK